MDVVLPAIIAAAISGVFAAFVTHKLNEKKEKKDFKKEKAEDLYLCFEKWHKYLFGNYLMMSLVYKGQIHIDDYHDDLISRSKEFNSDIPDRMKMIIFIYFPELKDQFAELQKTIEGMQSIFGEFKNMFKKTGKSNSKEALAQHSGGFKLLADQCADMSNAIVEVARQI